MGRVFLTKGFDKFARKERIADEVFVKRIDDADRGLIDGDLKGCLVKLSVARQGGGRTGGYRTICAFAAREKAFVIYGYPKNAKANMTAEEEVFLERAGRLLFEQTEEGLAALGAAGKIRELSVGSEE